MLRGTPFNWQMSNGNAAGETCEYTMTNNTDVPSESWTDTGKVKSVVVLLVKNALHFLLLSAK